MIFPLKKHFCQFTRIQFYYTQTAPVIQFFLGNCNENVTIFPKNFNQKSVFSERMYPKNEACNRKKKNCGEFFNLLLYSDDFNRNFL